MRENKSGVGRTKHSDSVFQIAQFTSTKNCIDYNGNGAVEPSTPDIAEPPSDFEAPYAPPAIAETSASSVDIVDAELQLLDAVMGQSLLLTALLE